MSKAQDDKCAICNKPETQRDRRNRVKSLCVDHNHSSGEVRSLLCSNCNTALGLLKEDVSIFEAAINYLKRYNG